MFDGDYEDSLYALDRDGRRLRLVPTHGGQVIDALERVKAELHRTKSDLPAWRWAIISLHLSVQDAMSQIVPEAWQRPKDLREAESRYLEALQSGKDTADVQAAYLGLLGRKIREGEPTGHLDKFLNLWDAAKQKLRVASDGVEDDALKRLNRERNKFVHFGGDPAADFDLRDYPNIVLACLDVLEFLGARMLWFGNTEDQFRAELAECKEVARKLATDYS